MGVTIAGRPRDVRCDLARIPVPVAVPVLSPRVGDSRGAGPGHGRRCAGCWSRADPAPASGGRCAGPFHARPPPRPRTPRPRSRRRRPRRAARRPAHRPRHRRLHRRRLPPHRGRRRRSTPRALRRAARPRGLLLVPAHLRQRRPRAVAAAPALHGGQPRPLGPARHTLRRPRPARGTHVRGPRTDPRAQPDRAADRGRLRGRARPVRLAVRGLPHLHRLPLPARLPRARRRLVGPAGAPPRPRSAAPRRADRAALVPVEPHLERLRVPAAARRLRRPGRRLRHGARARPPRILVRPPDRRPAARRAHRRRAAHRGGGRRHAHRPLRPAGRRPRPRSPRLDHPGAARRRRRHRGLGRLPARPHRSPGRPPARPGRRHPAARRRPRPPRRRPPPRLLVTPRLGLHRTAPRGLRLRRAHAGAGLLRARPRRRGPVPAPAGPRSVGRPARPRRARRRHARLRARRGDVRRSRPARRRLAGRRRHPRNGRHPAARAARAAVLAGRRVTADAPRTGPARRLLRSPRCPLPGPARRSRGRRVSRGGAGRGPQPPDRRGTDRGRAHRLRALVRGGRLRDHPGARRGRPRRSLAQRTGPGRSGPRDPAVAGGRRPRRPGHRVLAHRPRHRRLRHLGPPRLPGPLRPPDHRHPVGRGHLLAARGPPLRTALLRRARRPRPDLADGRLDRPYRRPPGDLRPLPGQRARRGGRLATPAARPPPGRPAHVRIPARPPLRPLVPRLLRSRTARRPAPGGRLLAQPLAGHRPHRRPGASRRGAGRGPRPARRPDRLRTQRPPPAARADPGPLRLPGRSCLRRRTRRPARPAGHGRGEPGAPPGGSRGVPAQPARVSKERAAPAGPGDPPGTAG